jgi:colicin import membrane protein
VGSSDRFELEPTALPTLPDRPRPEAVKAAPAPKPVPKHPPPDRSALNAAVAALHSIDERRYREAGGEA